MILPLQCLKFRAKKWANCTYWKSENLFLFEDECLQSWKMRLLNCIIFSPYLKEYFLITHYTCLTYLPNAMCVFILNKWNFGIVDSNAFRIICELFAAIKNLLNFPCEWSYYPPNKQMVIAFFLTIAQFWILPYIWLFHSVWK